MDEIRDSVLDAVGETPLVRLRRLDPQLRTPLVAKLEYLNPGGSIKDRAALAMVEAAERDGRLRPGGTIVELTAGNTGVGLAIAGRLKGYRVLTVMAEKMSPEKRTLLRAYGAEVVVVPAGGPETPPQVVERLERETPGAWRPDQWSNPANPDAHEATTGPELWRQSGGRVTHLVCGVGTGGTITGMARFLRARRPGLVVVAVDPAGSSYTAEGEERSYLVEGVGGDFWPAALDRALVDRWIAVEDAAAFRTTRALAEREGLLVGGSCGLAAHAALQVARELDDPAALVAVVLPDGGRSYLSKVFDDGWMAEHGFDA